jgi:hypothetical protein
LRGRVVAVKVELVFDDQPALERLLRAATAPAQARAHG